MLILLPIWNGGIVLLVWCLGNVLMGDDAVGCRVAELLFEKKLTGVVDCGTTPENHISALRKRPPPALLIVDAADMKLPPGEMRRLSLEELDGAAAVSHGVPVSLLLSPFTEDIEISVLGIQPCATQLGSPLSMPVEQAARRAADFIELDEWRKVEKFQPDTLKLNADEKP